MDVAQKRENPAARRFVPRRHQRKIKNSLLGITRPSIRRLARRGGTLRMEATIYDDIRQVVKARITEIIGQVVQVLESANTHGVGRKVITTRDIVFVLNRMRHPVYGF